MGVEFERLAYETALRGLDKQEELLKELRARTGVLLAAASLAASFLGTDAFRDPSSLVLVVLALLAFVTSIGVSVWILAPKEDLTFSQAGSALYERLYAHRDDLRGGVQAARLRGRPILGRQRRGNGKALLFISHSCGCTGR